VSVISAPSAFEGVLYDGRSASGRRVVVVVDGAALSIVDSESRAAITRSDVRVDAPIPGVARRLILPGGGSIESENNALVEALWPAQGFVSRGAFWLESRWSAAIAAVLLTAAFVWFVVSQILPLAAEPIARSISPRIEEAIGKQALRSIDATFAKPSRLPAERRREIDSKFEAFVENEPELEDVDLQFRRMGAPNAFALPGGIVVVTDEMVQFAKDDDELFAAIAHELGHLQARHAMRLVLQQSGIAVLVTAIAGDAAGMTFLAAAMPAAVLNAGYSREFELEADRYAYGHLKRHGSSPAVLARLFRRLAEDRHAADANDPLARYLSSHPALEERARLAEEAAR
jgi:predicted Zn-dependent protease